jgi:hypothetical protein
MRHRLGFRQIAFINAKAPSLTQEACLRVLDKRVGLRYGTT